jgi:hypothetical protein
VQDKIVEEYVELSLGPLLEDFTAKASALLYCTFPGISEPASGINTTS